jgi:hypothetical protein
VPRADRDTHARGAFVARATALRAVGLILLATLLPGQASGQAPHDRRVVRLEASYLAGAVSFATRVADGWFAGGGLGGGVDALRIVSGSDLFFGDDQENHELAQLSGFASWTPSPHLRTDVGLRASFIIYGDDDFSGTTFVGAYLAPAVGWRHIKAGPRLQAGHVRVGGRDGVAVFFKPLVVSVTFGW